ncbi:MAG: hypothetical protein RLZZ618_3344 [Pseudomonadota bacterium]|jgi:predicted TIM-barrel fold metal-dependent hydrolase
MSLALPESPHEDILEPGLAIVDPHHHLWDHRAFYAAQPATPQPKAHGFADVVRLSPRYLLDELAADTRSGHRVIATVFVECSSAYRREGPPALRPVGETEFVHTLLSQSTAASEGFQPCAGIVGHADLTLGAAVAEVLQAHIAAGGGRFRGIRHTGAHDADRAVLGPLSRTPADLFSSPDFRAGFAQLGPLGLSFDAWVVEPQLPQVTSLAQAFPGTSIVLDHVGTPLGVASYAGRRDERFAVWRQHLFELAACPNVSVKLGGLAMPFVNLPSWMAQPAATSEQLAREWRPYIENCIEAFGAARCMFESNFPVDRGVGSYATVWNAFKRLAAGASANEKTALFSGTAARVYRLDV